ncbi:WD40 repeat domain-containing protein [Marinimicrobium sp. ABcell2]|uniref:WD40 repeat domain-containing protein n=1 Tax=Marinimicrobium sp. ABcell2 TaxID=3069751 RepID=UPI0027B2A068|nr:hypothetical protein [Marinimicrobium sp. ABcell2]MDQ2076121.1 hypothetical protein [Marinimicrobium sp. ABcell2]
MPKRFAIHGSLIARTLGAVFVLLALSGCERPGEPEASLEVAVRSVSAGVLVGDRALLGSTRHGGSYWNLTTQERLYSWNHTSGEATLMTAVGLSPQADWALTSDRNTLVLWNAQTGAAEQFWSSPAEVIDLALGVEGERAFLGLTDHRAALYNVKRGGVIRSFPHEGPVTTVSLSADGRLALTGSDDGSAVLWNADNGEALARHRYSTDVHLVRLSPNGERALSATRYDGVSIWSTQDDDVWKLPQGEERLKRGLRISAARFSDDGAYLLTGRPDGLVQLWDLEARTLMYTWRLPKRKRLQPTATVVLDVGFTEDLNRYRAMSSNGFVHELAY